MRGLVAALLLVATCSTVRADPPAFDEARAFRELSELVGFGPRTLGSESSSRARALITERLRQAGWPAQMLEFRIAFEDGRGAQAVNLVARQERAGAPVLLLVTHYDSKDSPSGGSPGANTSASGVALLLEVARQYPSGLQNTELWLAFCDAAEPVGPTVTPKDGLYGSRDLARMLELDGTLARAFAVIYVQRVADRDLRLSPGQPRSQTLARMLARAAAESGDSDLVDLESAVPVPGDHRPFRQRGIRDTLAMVDFRFGAGAPPGELTYSLRDDLMSVSSRSLGRSGQVLLRLIRILDESAHQEK